LLPSKKLKPYYDKISWLYVCRLFKPSDARDREALRTHERFGISSWPQMFVFDPATGRVLREMPRSLAGFKAGLDAVLADRKPAPPEGLAVRARLQSARKAIKAGRRHKAVAILTRLAAGNDRFEGWLEARELLRSLGVRAGASKGLGDPDPRERALALEAMSHRPRAIAKARPHIERLVLDDGEDIVVRLRALRCIGAVDPGWIAKNAASMLDVANDPWRYAVLEFATQHPNPELGPVLCKLFEGAGTKVASRNPNVLRINVTLCLAECGDVASLRVLQPVVAAADPRNGLTRMTVAAVAKIATRERGAARDKVLRGLLEGVPEADDSDEVTAARRKLAIVRAVVDGFAEVFGRDRVPVAPRTWTRADQKRLTAALSALLRE